MHLKWLDILFWDSFSIHSNIESWQRQKNIENKFRSNIFHIWDFVCVIFMLYHKTYTDTRITKKDIEFGWPNIINIIDFSYSCISPEYRDIKDIKRNVISDIWELGTYKGRNVVNQLENAKKRETKTFNIVNLWFMALKQKTFCLLNFIRNVFRYLSQHEIQKI